MRTAALYKLLAVAIIATVTFSTVACRKSLVTHKLVATSGEHSIAMYPDEATFLKVSRQAQQGGVGGMVGDVQKNFSAKRIDDQTPVKIISRNDNGAMVQIVSGPMQGQTGFVASQNLE